MMSTIYRTKRDDEKSFNIQITTETKFGFEFSPASYFDNRFFVVISLTQLVSIITIPLIITFFGLNIFTILISLIQIFFGKYKCYIHLPFYSKYDDCEPPKYSIDYHDNSLWFHYGEENKYKCINMPWYMEWYRTSVLLKDNIWEHDFHNIRPRKEFYQDFWLDKTYYEKFPYVYELSNGKIQIVNATIYTTEREWRPRWFMWTSLFNSKSKVIDITFDGEVGERSGSWKGGTLGCSYQMLPNEEPYQTLQRMSKERKFN